MTQEQAQRSPQVIATVFGAHETRKKTPVISHKDQKRSKKLKKLKWEVRGGESVTDSPPTFLGQSRLIAFLAGSLGRDHLPAGAVT